MNSVGLTRAAKIFNAPRAGGHAIPDFNLETALRRAVTLGIAKVNVATELALVFTNAVREQLENPKLNDPRQYLDAARDAMTERARAVIRLLGASGKAVVHDADAQDARETVGA